ncbi:MAG: M48 family metalloprotease, partial [Sulfobacillus sp.]
MPQGSIDRKASLADRGLTWRMSVSYVLLGAVYVLFMWILLQAGVGYLPMVVILGGMLIVQYYFSDKMVLAASGAKVVAEGQEPELSGMVAKLAQLADLPTPRLAIIDTPVPNAFATGRDPHHSVVAVTRGLTERLTPAEVEA